MSTARRAEARPNRFRSWRNGWGTALRMARREIGRDRLRTGFVWLMIFLPVGVICGLHIVIASSDMSHQEMVALQTGGGQASLRYLGAGGTPDWDGAGGVWLSGDGGETPATPVPGWGSRSASRRPLWRRWPAARRSRSPGATWPGRTASWRSGWGST